MAADLNFDSDLNDSQLVALAQADRAAFGILYRRHVTRIYRYIYARVGQAQTAEDLTAQVFLIALQALPRYREQGTFAAWLVGIARNTTAEHFRSARPLIALDDQIEQVSAGSAEDSLQQIDEIELVARALRQIADDRADVVRLRIFAGLSTLETAQTLGKTEAAVKMLLHRALRDLRQYIRLHEVQP